MADLSILSAIAAKKPTPGDLSREDRAKAPARIGGGPTPAPALPAAEAADPLPIAEKKRPAKETTDKQPRREEEAKRPIQNRIKPQQAYEPPVSVTLSLGFENLQSFERAQKLAARLNVPVAEVSAAILRITKIEPRDFDTAAGEVSPLHAAIRGKIVMPGAEARAYITARDPFGLHRAGNILRPVGMQAFNRAAMELLAEWEKK